MLDFTQEGSEKLFKIFADSLPHMAFVANAQGDITYFNTSWYEYIGAIQDTEGWGWKEHPIHHPDDFERTVARWKKSLETGEPYEIEYRLRRFDGVYRWHHGRANPVKDNQGKIIWWIGTNTDIHENKILITQLAESETKFKTIADAMPQMVWSTLPDGYHDYYNNRWYEYTGVPQGSTDGEGWNDMFHPDDQETAWKVWNHSLQTGEPYKIEYRLKHHSGTYRWTLGRAMPIKNDEGKIIRWMGTCTDIHDIKENESLIKKTQEDLKKSVAARDEFLSVASHELKTPLTSLRLQIQAMQRNFIKGRKEAFSMERVGEMITSNDRQITRLVRLVDDMLDLSRIESGKLSFKFSESDFSDIISEVYNHLKENLHQAGCKTTLNLTTSTPINCDRERLEQVITNILTNAMRYGKNNPIYIHLENRSDKCLLEIKDNGIGISPTNVEVIFNRFERLVNANEVSGLGLGLYISREIIDAHQGRIWVESKEGFGSSFFVELPLLA